MYLGIDFSLRHTGFYICSGFIGDKDAYHESGLLETKQEYSTVMYSWYVKQFTELLKSRDWKKIVIEDYAFSKNTCYAMFTKEVVGILKLLIAKMGLQSVTSIVPPQLPKMVITGSGAGEKSLMMKKLYKKYGIDVDDDNIADACGLCAVGYALDNIELRESLPKNVQKSLSKFVGMDLDGWFGYVQERGKKKRSK